MILTLGWRDGSHWRESHKMSQLDLNCSADTSRWRIRPPSAPSSTSGSLPPGSTERSSSTDSTSAAIIPQDPNRLSTFLGLYWSKDRTRSVKDRLWGSHVRRNISKGYQQMILERKLFKMGLISVNSIFWFSCLRFQNTQIHCRCS